MMLNDILLSNGIERIAESERAPVFYTTGESESFQGIVEDWLSIEKPNVRHIEL